jgi:uncharacterized protein YndB with AHSA1/START domain
MGGRSTPPIEGGRMAKDFNATVSMEIDAPATKVWDGITNPDMIARYMMGARVDTDWRVGHPITWSGEIDGKRYQDKGEILVVEPLKRLSMTHWSPLSDADDVPENYHVVTYELAPVGDGTRLTLTQSNNPSQEAADAMAKNGWLPMLQTLKKLLEA